VKAAFGQKRPWLLGPFGWLLQKQKQVGKLNQTGPNLAGFFNLCSCVEWFNLFYTDDKLTGLSYIWTSLIGQVS
jgi:hypothetical protein